MLFRSVGAFGNDDVLYAKVAPLFAKWGIKSYATFTHVYDLLYAGGSGWARFAKLQSQYGWDAIPHSWNHGGTALGANLTLSSLVAALDVVTATYTSAHLIPLGRKFRARISGASISAANGVFEMTATAANQVQYTATGAGSATATGTIRINTFMSEVFSTDTAENRRLVSQEWTRNAQAMRATGFARGVPYIAYPNNPTANLFDDGVIDRIVAAVGAALLVIGWVAHAHARHAGAAGQGLAGRMTVKRRNLDNTRALHIALTVAANELEWNMGGEAIDQLVAQAGGSEFDADAARRKIKALAAQLQKRAANLYPYGMPQEVGTK